MICPSSVTRAQLTLAIASARRAGKLQAQAASTRTSSQPNGGPQVNRSHRHVLIASALAEIKLRKTTVGTILVNSRGFTVYAFTRDPRNRDMCVALRGCSPVWPAVTTTGKPIAGHGVRASLLNTINLRGGRKQMTYAGHPLYTYVGDSAPGET